MKKNKITNVNKSLSKRLSFILIIGVSIVFSFSTLTLYSFNKNTALVQFDEKNRLSMKQLSATLAYPIWNLDEYSIASIAKAFAIDSTVSSLNIYNEKNIPLYSYKKNDAQDISLYKKQIIYNEAGYFDNETIGRIEISFSKDELNKQLYSILFTNIFLLLVTLITISLVTLVVSKILLKTPLNALINATVEFGQGNYNTNLNIGVKEFEPLIKVLNTMGNKISKQLFLLEENKINLEKKVQTEVNRRKEQEQFLIQKSRHADMGNMIAMIAHQWRQPLSAMNTITQNIHLAYHMDKLDKEFIDSQIKRSNQIAQSMSSTIDDFRNFFKLNKEKKEFLVSEVINESINLLNDTLIYNEIHIKKDFLKNENKILGFKNELSQVIVNLLVNAKDAFAEKKDISYAQISIDIKEIKQHIEITVQDNAGGIPSKLLARIFEPYFSTKGEKNATGLGLYMCKIIIEQNMEGSLQVNNEDKGARFVISIPLNDTKKEIQS